jgi:phosphohistidine phosphatase
MNLYFIRHGKSEPASLLKKDKDRELTNDGIKILKASFDYWKNVINEFDFILTSPLLRAVQTSEIISKVIGFNGNIIKENLMLPGGNTNSLIELVNSLERENIALIGHQPDLSFHTSRLISSKEVNLKYSPGAIAKIVFEGKSKLRKGELVFLLPQVNADKKG